MQCAAEENQEIQILFGANITDLAKKSGGIHQKAAG